MGEFFKWTETKKVNGKLRPVTDAPCWFDLTRSDCGRCKNGGGQCGAPMERWCQNPRNKNGCEGVPNNKYTLSCQCDQGLTGNGQQCFSGDCSSGNCTLVSHAEENVEISIDTN